MKLIDILTEAYKLPPRYKRIVGIDLSLSSTGICISMGDNKKAYSVATQPRDGMFGRYHLTLTSIMDAVNKDTTDYMSVVILEDYAYGFNTYRKSSSILQLAEIAGIVKYNLYFCGTPTFLVSPTMLKKWVTGKGTSKKDEMRLHLFKKYNVEFETTDEGDAYGLADFGRHLLGLGDRELSAMEKDTLKKYKTCKVTRII